MLIQTNLSQHVSIYCYKNIEPRGTSRSQSVFLPQSEINYISAIFWQKLGQSDSSLS